MRKLKLQELGRIDTLSYQNQKKFPIIVFLNNIRSGHNVGAAFRTADAFNIEKIILSGITPQPPHKEIFKAAIGASQSVLWEHTDQAITWLKTQKQLGYNIVAVEQTTQSIALQKLPTDKLYPCVLIFGNEVDGVANDLLPIVDYALEIPQFGTKHSLNVSVCIGVVLWQCIQKFI